MKLALKFSLFINSALMVLLFLLLTRPVSNLHVLESRSKADGGASEGAEAHRLPAEAPFQWSQIESTDYRTYIANLRGIGCPEQTIRDIVTADLHNLYAHRRASSKNLNGIEEGDPRAVQAEKEQEALNNEEQAVLAAFLGPTSDSALTSTSAPSAPARSTRFKPIEPELPLVFQPVETASLSLDAGQRQALDTLQQWFIEQLGGEHQDPADPGYRERWLNAQSQMDDLTRGMIGVNAFQDYQLAARAAAQQKQIP